MAEPCPSDLALDDGELHGGDAAAALAPHLSSCERCRGRQAERRRLATRFDAGLSAVAWRRIATARPARRRWLSFGLAAALVGGAATIVVVRAVDLPPRAAYRGVKGALGVEAVARRSGLVFRPDDRAPLRPGDELELVVRAADPALRNVLVGSVDGTGRFSPFYPAELTGESVGLPPAGAPLAPPVMLDDAPGPERVLVVVSSQPLSVAAVRPLAEAAAADLRAIHAVGGARVAAAWLSIPKQARGR